MKFVAAKDFHNSKALGINLDPKAAGFRHPNHIHKGARFALGTSESYKELSPLQQEQAGTLLKHNCAVIDSKENAENGVIKGIDDEAKREIAAYDTALKPAPSIAELVAAAVAGALAEAGLIKPSTAK